MFSPIIQACQDNFTKLRESFRASPFLISIACLHILVIATFFILPKAPHRLLFHVTLFLSLFILNKEWLKRFWDDYKPLLIITFTFLGYCFLSSFWSQTITAESIGNALKIPVFVFVFLASFYRLQSSYESFLPSLVKVTLLAATGSCLYVLIANGPWTIEHELINRYRLIGIGRDGRSTDYGALMGTALMLLWFTPYVAKTKEKPVLFYGLSLLFLIALELTWARAAMLGFVVASAFTLFFKKEYKTMFFLFMAGVLALIGLYFSTDILQTFLERGLTRRDQIWEQAIEFVKAAPIFGNGIASEFLFRVKAHAHPNQNAVHNIPLGTLLSTGLIGLVLFLTLLAFVVRSTYRYGKRTRIWYPFAGVVAGFVIMQFSGNTIFVNLSKDWWYVWIPLAMTLSAGKEEKKQNE